MKLVGEGNKHTINQLLCYGPEQQIICVYNHPHYAPYLILNENASFSDIHEPPDPQPLYNTLSS